MSVFQDRTAIVGVGETMFAKGLAGSELDLACAAITAALADAGVSASEVDAVGSYTMEATTDFELARQMGFGDLHYFSQTSHGGGAAPGTVGHVAMAIACGIAEVGVVWRSRKRSGAASRVWGQTASVLTDHWKWSRPSGLLRPVDEIAMLTQRYFHEFGCARDALAEIAVRQRAYANANPNAQMRDRGLSHADYFASRMIAEPLCLFDNCLESDGAVAVVITSAERARDLRERPVLVHAYSQGMVQGHQPMADFHRQDTFDGCSSVVGRNLWRQAAMGPGDVDVAQIYDAFSPLILFSLEAYGICGRGEAADFVRGATLPVNTAGGGLSEGYIHGMNLVAEGVRQMRGTAANQVAGAETCLVTGCDSTPNGALLLRRPQ